MRKINVSDAVWGAIAERGKFGETEDDVLRRVFGITPPSSSTQHDIPSITRPRPGRIAHAKKRLSNDMIRNGRLYIELEDAPVWFDELPSDKADRSSIRRVRDNAYLHARKHGASDGQLNAIGKALQQAGYYLRGPRS